MSIESPRSLDENLFSLFWDQAMAHPDRPAVAAPEGDTCYRALAARAGHIAEELLDRGLQPEQPVGVLMHRTAEMVAALLGILKAGGCYVPLDPDDPIERNRLVVAGSQCALLLGHSPLLRELDATLTAGVTGTRPQLIDVETIIDRPSRNPKEDTASTRTRSTAPGGDRLAYILFTSGSTGVPKGVEVEHRSLINLLNAAQQLFGFTSDDRYMATSTIGFDISVAELFLPLITGGTVVLRDRRLLQDPHRLAEEVSRNKVTVFQTGPSVWSVLLREVPNFPRIRVAISTGEAIAPDLARRLSTVGRMVWNLYGPTEATVWATGHRLDGAIHSGEPGISTVSAPIGHTLANVDAIVVDPEGREVANGEEGELYLGGLALARGYRNNAALTAERFVFFGAERRRYYRTGDVVRMDSDGTLHYFGRNDDQIKVRGVRIEPKEVESAIESLAGVEQAAATWFSTESGSRSIVAAVVAAPGNEPTIDALYSELARTLPTAMIPSRFVFVSALPLSPAGKVDRNAIRALANSALPAATSNKAEPMTDTERKLLDIWERTLGISSVTKDDHFFTVGGDSLSAVTMLLDAESTFDVSLPIRLAFEAPTLDRLAARIDVLMAESEDTLNSEFIFPLVKQGEGTPFFFNWVDLKLARKGLWLINCPLFAVSRWAQGSGFIEADSVESLAKVHIEGIKAIQPEGPYRIGGYSFGGMIALEIAQQLRRDGDRVELLFLLDPTEPFRGAMRRFCRHRRGRRVSDSPNG